MSADPQRVQSVFAKAADLAAGERAAVLEAECRGDAALRRRVEALLAAHDETGHPLDRPPAALAATDLGRSVDPSAGERVGPYTLLQKLGEGGMGAVWAAEQHAPVRRRVALKLIKAGMDSAQVLRRFEAERQALALMDHTNIAKVFDAGTTPDGRPYFAMELVKGVPITRYCDDLNLSVRDRLGLFVPVCQAIQHAHTKGVVHRDVKPSNVLVCIQDGKPVPKVIDFGVAKALHRRLAEQTVYTEIGAVVGTLEYMAPEQAELSALDVDTRADVYALGALLYELLTGTTPLDRRRLASAGLAEMMRIIKEEEPPRPSTRLSESRETLPGLAAHRRTEPARLTKEVRGDLDWIVMRCLEKDRTRRYETANGVARDVQRFLADEPVEARPPSRGYRLKKLARRNKGPLAAAGLALTALVAGAAIATWQAVRATNAENLADNRYRSERAARKEADAARKTAIAEKKIADTERGRAVTEADRATAVADFLRSLLRSADPRESRGAAFTVRELLDEAAAGLPGRFAGQPEVEADVRAAIGAAYTYLDLGDLGEPHLRRALELRRGAPARDDIAYAESLIDWGWSNALRNRRGDVPAAAREAIAIYRGRGDEPQRLLGALRLLQSGVLGTAEVDTVAAEAVEVARAFPQAEHAELASILHVQADEWARAGKGEAAERLARRALAMHRRTQPAGHPETAWAVWVLGLTLEKQGKFVDAEAAYHEAVDLFQAAYGSRPDSLGQSTAVASLVWVLRAQGKDPDEALRLNDDLPEAALRGAPETPEAALRRAGLYLSLNRLRQAVAALDLASELAADRDEVLLLERLAGAYKRASEAFGSTPDRAAEESARAEEIRYWERLVELAPDEYHRSSLAAAHANQGLLYQKGGRNEEAAARFTAAVELFAALADDFPEARHYRQEQAYFSRQSAYALGMLSRYDEAIEAARRAIGIDDALAAEFPNDRATRQPADPTFAQRASQDRIALLRLLLRAGRADDAAAEFRSFQGTLNSSPELNDLAWNVVRERTASPAAARFAVSVAEAAVSLPDADGVIWNTLGVARYRAGDWPGAAGAIAKSAEMLGDRFFAYNAFFSAMASQRLGDDAAARGWYARAAEWADKHAPQDEELRWFRAEAEEVLGISHRPPGGPVEAPRPTPPGSP